MSLYAVKNDKGDYLNGVAGEKPLFGGLDKDCVLNGEDAGWLAGRGYGHVVELIEAPAKVVVSEAEASLLEKMADGTNFNGERGFEPGLVITNFVLNNRVHGESHFETEDRLMHAYVNGWTVEKPKRYGVWVPHVTGKMYFKDGRGNDGLDIASADCLNESNQQFTLAEIEHYGLGECERVEVTDDDTKK